MERKFTKKIYLEPQKSVLGCSILHYSQRCQTYSVLFTEITCVNDGGDHEVMWRRCQLILAEWEGVRMYEWWGWSM